jgi:serine/threonine protein kinase
MLKRIALGYFEFSSQVNVSARALISGLLEKNLSRRLGCTDGGAEEIMRMEWFSEVDWKLVSKKAICPPWIPELNDESDVQYFDSYEEEPEELQKLTKDDQALFNDF